MTGFNDSKMSAMLEHPPGQRINHFSFELMRQLPVQGKNYVVSPFSISTALAMTYAGAAEQTAAEMTNTLFFDPDKARFLQEYSAFLDALNEMAGETLQLNIANALWAHEGYHFLPDYFNTITQYFGSELRNVNFRGELEPIRQQINRWVYDQTREKIDNLIAPGVLTEDTRLVLVNAIHFLGKWMSEFNKNNTRKDIFHTIDGQKAEKEFMRRTAWYRYYRGIGLQAIELPYAGGNFSMVVVLPDEDTGIDQVAKRLDAAEFLTISTQMRNTHVDLRLPRFEIETSVDLERLLSDMGMPTAFSKRADFSGMTGDDSLMIDKVIHRAMIDVEESGTEAAAATAVVMIMKTSIDPEPEETIPFHADRPFLFFIKDNTYHSILFMGKLVK